MVTIVKPAQNAAAQKWGTMPKVVTADDKITLLNVVFEWTCAHVGTCGNGKLQSLCNSFPLITPPPLSPKSSTNIFLSKIYFQRKPAQTLSAAVRGTGANRICDD